MEFIMASAFEALDASLLSSEMTEADSCTVVGIFVLNHGSQKQKIPGELTERRDAPKLEKLFACRGSSLVERRPEKAGVASSILAPGTTSPSEFPLNLQRLSLRHGNTCSGDGNFLRPGVFGDWRGHRGNFGRGSRLDGGGSFSGRGWCIVAHRRGRDVARVDGEQRGVLFDPFGGEAVERAFGVELLIANHAADADDKVVETFRGRPEIADTNLRVIEIRMKDRRKHATLRRAARIAEGKINFHDVGKAFEYLAVVGDVEAFEVVRDAIDFRRDAGGASDLNDGPIRKTRGEHLVVKHEAACTGRWHVRKSLR